jgi:hypothetical protein
VAAHYGKNRGGGIADYQIADQREAEALFLDRGPAEADYGKIAGAHLCVIHTKRFGLFR